MVGHELIELAVDWLVHRLSQHLFFSHQDVVATIVGFMSPGRVDELELELAAFGSQLHRCGFH